MGARSELVVAAYQPRTASRSCSGICLDGDPRIGAPRPLLTSAIFFASSKNVVAWTMALAIRAGSSLLKMPEPTNTPSEPSCITSAASAGVAMPPATKFTTGSLPSAATCLTSSYGRLQLLGRDEQLVLAHALEAADLGEHVAELADGLDDVAGAGLALGPHHRGALVDPPQRLAEVPAAAHERDLEGVLVDVVRLVGRGQDLGLVDVVDPERLEDLRLDEVADPGLRHHRDADRLHDAFDHAWVAHPGDAAGGADVGRHALERHDGDGAGILGDARMVRRDHVHDDPALEHLGEAGLRGPGRGLDGHVGLVLRWSRAVRRPAGPGVLARSSRVGAASRAGLSHGFLGRPGARSGVPSRGRASPGSAPSRRTPSGVEAGGRRPWTSRGASLERADVVG